MGIIKRACARYHNTFKKRTHDAKDVYSPNNRQCSHLMAKDTSSRNLWKTEKTFIFRLEPELMPKDDTNRHINPPPQGVLMRLKSVLICILAFLFVSIHAQKKIPPPTGPKPAPRMIQPKKKPPKIKKVKTPAATVKKAPPKAAPTKGAPAPAGGKMEVRKAVIAREIVDRVPKDDGTEFSADVRRLYCFTEIINGTDGEIRHRWFFNNKKVSEVSLKIKSDRYRTYSSKTIIPEMAGAWKVDIVDAADKSLLHSLEFIVK